MKSTVLAMRWRISAMVFSVSGIEGGAMPARRAIAPLDVSLASWNWLSSGCMSGARRVLGSSSAPCRFAFSAISSQG